MVLDDLSGLEKSLAGKRHELVFKFIDKLPTGPEGVGIDHLSLKELDREGKSLADLIQETQKAAREFHRASEYQHRQRAGRTRTLALKLAKAEAPDLPRAAIVQAWQDLCQPEPPTGRGRKPHSNEFNWFWPLVAVHARVRYQKRKGKPWSVYKATEVVAQTLADLVGMPKPGGALVSYEGFHRRLKKLYPEARDQKHSPYRRPLAWLDNYAAAGYPIDDRTVQAFLWLAAQHLINVDPAAPISLPPLKP